VTYSTTAYRAVVLLGLAAVLAACTSGDDDARQRDASAKPEVAGSSGGQSIYDLDLSLTDQDGHTLALADLRGRVLVAAMIYTSCTSVCPRVTEDMKGVEKQLSAGDRKNVGFVLFSLDPGRDTPAALRRFAAEHALDPSRWRLFAASEDGVRDLSAVLGVKYKAEDNGEIAHSAMIFIIDREGVIRHRQLGLNPDPHELTSALADSMR
jgi:protein SCO1/2